MKVTKIKRSGRKETVYDISVNKYQNYVLQNGVVTHNSGLKYAASTIVMLSKKKEKEGNDVVGNVIHCKTYKSRLSKENQMVDVKLYYDMGLDRYYGLLELAEKYGVLERMGTRFIMPDGSKVYAKVIYKDPEKYFTKDLMDQIDAAAQKAFSYGGNSVEEDEDTNDEVAEQLTGSENV